MRYILPKFVVTAVLAYTAGIGLQSFFSEKTIFLFLTGAVLAVIALAIFWNRRRAIFVFVGVLFVYVGLWHAGQALEHVEVTDLVGKEIRAVGTILEDPKETEFSKRITVRLQECDGSTVTEGCKGVRVAAYADRFTDARYGQEVKVSCILEKPEKFTEEFDWPMYLAGKKIYYQCLGADVEVLEDGKKTLLGVLGRVRASLEANMQRAIPQPQSALASGLLFGGDHRLSEEVSEQFARTSMTHIVAVSGYNVSLLAGYAMWFGILVGLWRFQAMFLAFLFIGLFVLLIGFPSSAIRAAIMGSIMLWALSSGRATSGLRILLFASAAMLSWNPLLLRWDTGFQLSVLATMGIVALSPYMPRAFTQQKTLGLRETLYITIVAQFFVLPIILHTFGIFSFVSVAANVLILWTIPITMLFTFLAALVEFVFAPLAFVVGFPGYALLTWTLTVVRFFSEIQWSIVEFESFSPIWIVLWYILIGGFLYYLHWKDVWNARNLCKIFNKR